MAFDCICLQCMPMDEAVFISIMIQVDFILENILCAIFSCAASVRLHLGISRHSPCAKSADVVKQVYAKCVCVCAYFPDKLYTVMREFFLSLFRHIPSGENSTGQIGVLFSVTLLIFILLKKQNNSVGKYRTHLMLVLLLW